MEYISQVDRRSLRLGTVGISRKEEREKILGEMTEIGGISGARWKPGCHGNSMEPRRITLGNTSSCGGRT